MPVYGAQQIGGWSVYSVCMYKLAAAGAFIRHRRAGKNPIPGIRDAVKWEPSHCV